MKTSLLTALFCFSAIICNALDAQLTIHATGNNPSMIFMENEIPEFRLAQIPEPSEYTITVKDRLGETVHSGQYNGGSFKLPALPCGYYKITMTGVEGERGFAVLKPRRDRRVEETRSSAYAVDLAAYSSYKYQNDAMGGIKVLADICGKLGVGFVRNRLIWNTAAPTPESSSHPDFLRGYQRVAAILKAHGIASSVTFHDAPAWSKDNSKQILPSDLAAVYDFCRKAAAIIPEISVWEFWNEHDGLKAWELAAAHKAAYLGFKAGRPTAQVTTGSLVIIPFMVEAKNRFRNDIGQYCDIFNYHVYSPLPEYPKINAAVHKLLAQSHISGKPVWITENGTMAEGYSEVASSPITPIVPVQSDRQEMLWAEFVPKGHILSQANGVERIFTFILRRKQEPNKQWGLLHPDFSVKPGAVTFAVLNYELGDAVFEGELKVPHGFRAFLYTQPDHSQTVAIWKQSKLDTSPQKFLPKDAVGQTIKQEIFLDDAGVFHSAIPPRLPDTKLFDIAGLTGSNAFGSSLELNKGARFLSFNAENYVCYLSGLKGLHPAVPTTPPQSVPAENIADKSIVLQAKVLDVPGRLRLTIYNFEDKSKSGFLKVIAGKINGLPDKIELPGMSKLVFELSVERGKDREIEIAAVLNGNTSSRLMIPFSEFGLFTEEAAPEMSNQAFWAKSSSGEMTISFDEPEKTLIFRTVFQPGADRWSYPRFNLKTVGLDLSGAYGISFEMKQDIPSGDHPQKASYLCWLDRNRFVIPPSYGQWTTCRVLFPSNSKPEEIKTIGIGLNPRYDDLTFRLRNFKILR